MITTIEGGLVIESGQGAEHYLAASVQILAVPGL